MFEPNVSRILEQLTPSDIVLDIGGWACPFNRANYIIDAEPYETRGYYRTFGAAPFQAGPTEHFRNETWIRRDLCEHTPYPFADKSIDFVICSHTLEDLRDPLWVCSEMARIAKRGYIEVPSRPAESSRGWEHPRLAGLSHHRWLIDITGSHIRFLMKYHRIHSHWRLSLPASHLQSMLEEQKVQWLFWNDCFTWEEITVHSLDRIDAELDEYVRRTRPYPAWSLHADAAWRRVTGLGRRALTRLRGDHRPRR